MSLTELEEGLREGEREYSITVRKIIRLFDSVWVSMCSRAGRGDCRVGRQDYYTNSLNMFTAS